MTLTPSSSAANPGSEAITFTVAMPPSAITVPVTATTGTAVALATSMSTPLFSASTAYTYTLDKGDGSPTGPCSGLGTTSANGMLPATNLTGLTVVYATVGTKTVVLRVFKAGNCPAGLIPSSFAEPEAVGITSIQVNISTQ